MSQRPNSTKWLWCFLVLSSGPAFGPVSGITVRTPETIPSTIEAQAKFFQDFFSVQLSPYKIEFGHVCEDPNTWEQRYEKKDFKNHRDMGKIRWGDKKGGYGEHYWDLNHAAPTGNQKYQEDGDDYDDGSYNEELQDYPETIAQSKKYDGEDYDPEASIYEKTKRPKRENSILELKSWKGDRRYEEENRQVNTGQTKFKRHLDSQVDFEVENTNELNNPRRLRQKHNEENHNDKDYEGTVMTGNTRFGPYKSSSGKLYGNKVIPTPRLYLQSTTGHVIDSATGKAYVLQPITN